MLKLESVKSWTQNLLALAFPAIVLTLMVGCGGSNSDTVELLNVSYDPTRELWRDLNEHFKPIYEEKHGKRLVIRQSHGGSGPQARGIIDGVEADVATLALWSDTDALRKAGLIKDNWIEQFPNRNLPYTSTIVFVVRKGNPKNIKDWPDLVKGDVKVITSSPKTSGNGKLSYLAAWGSVITTGGSEDDAKAYVKELYTRVPVLDTGARSATVTFAQRDMGDVHLTWENEAHLEVKEFKGDLEIIYPTNSILAEPHIAIVDKNVDARHTREAAEEYLGYLYTPEAQEIIAKHYYRPSNPEILAANRDKFPEMRLYPVTEIAKDFDEAQTKFFSEGGLFDSIYTSISR